MNNIYNTANKLAKEIQESSYLYDLIVLKVEKEPAP